MGVEAQIAPTLSPDGPETIRRTVECLRSGGVVAVPTDTVYGLIAQFDQLHGVERIFEVKGRPATLPLPVLLGTAAELPLVASEIPASLWPLTQAFWPGPLTIVLSASRAVSKLITAGTGTVGVRVPRHPAILDLLEALSLPVASTSANVHGMVPASSAKEVLHSLGAFVDLIIASDQPLSGLASTVVDLTRQPVLVRRQGSITATHIREVIGQRVDVAASAAT